MGQGDSAEDFDPSESMENAGILYVFPVALTEPAAQGPPCFLPKPLDRWAYVG